MILYSDGIEAKIGDIVYLANGDHSGKVQFVIESADELTEWELDTPGLIIDTSFGGYVFYDEAQLKQDQVKLQLRSSA